jgi:hypothetical protein
VVLGDNLLMSPASSIHRGISLFNKEGQALTGVDCA